VRLFSGTALPGLLWQAWKHGRLWPRGVIDLTLPAEKKGKRTTGKESAASTSHLAPEKTGRKRTPSGEIGSALRSVYDGALAEDIPPEMLDLLGKLG
jgi:hypothetical protein